MAINNFNPIVWINEHLDIPFDEEEIAHVRDFTLMWNLFEKIACERQFNEQSIRRHIRESNIDSVRFAEYFNYFVGRYVNHENANNYFSHLFNHRDSAQRTFVQNVLHGIDQTNENIIIVCILISYRYRNNLFHGNKELREIHHQRTNLNAAMNVLAIFLENIPNMV
ncbi:hypothetical protein HNS38_10255 [Lentimicrobium sp. L6]|uniref:hypothetical protein n=1 Tax=Lentimicrobium sp. L6 TaxID=2735916 RepID=UPI0015570864|nr:hypothetical protein [Lentimicrobium sp. L6]NPD85143.1 hypothetical protein [Lentimicrobium sp. L6]